MYPHYSEILTSPPILGLCGRENAVYCEVTIGKRTIFYVYCNRRVFDIRKICTESYN